MEQTSFHILKSCYVCSKALGAKGQKYHGSDDKAIATVKKLFSCGKCHVASYCSQDCQRKDWKAHKVWCQPTDAPFNKAIIEKTIVHYFGSHLQDSLDPSGDITDMLLRQGYAQFFLESKEKRVEWTVNSQPVLSYDAWQGQPCIDEASGTYELVQGRPMMGIRQLHKVKSEGSSLDKAHSGQLAHLLEKHQDRLIITVEITKQHFGPSKKTWTVPVGNWVYTPCWTKEK